MTTLKTCFKCGVEKPRTEFYAHPMMGDGLLGKCKECARVDVRANRAAKLAFYRAYDKRKYLRNVGGTYLGRYVLDSAERVKRGKAADRVYAAVRSGKIKPQPCWVCGKKAQGHHPNYDAPLDVVWLCPAHHAEVHSMVYAEKKAAA